MHQRHAWLSSSCMQRKAGPCVMCQLLSTQQDRCSSHLHGNATCCAATPATLTRYSCLCCKHSQHQEQLLHPPAAAGSLGSPLHPSAPVAPAQTGAPLPRAAQGTHCCCWCWRLKLWAGCWVVGCGPCCVVEAWLPLRPRDAAPVAQLQEVVESNMLIYAAGG
jgi:hypothetical protein